MRDKMLEKRIKALRETYTQSKLETVLDFINDIEDCVEEDTSFIKEFIDRLTYNY